jgi:hypothetical protein
MIHLRLGDRPESQVWINHPGEVIHSGYGRPSYWGGCGTVPRVQQYRSLAVVDFAAHPAQPDFTHAWLPETAMDDVLYDGSRILLRAGDGLCLIAASGPLERVATGPTAGCEVRLAGHRGRWILRLSDVATEGSLAAFGERFAGLAALDGPDGAIVIEDPDFGTVICGSDASVTSAHGSLDPAQWTRSGDLRSYPDGTRIVLPSQHQRRPESQKTA